MSLPRFVIAGERRCGTTSLYWTLAEHAEVFLPDRTDFNFFIDDRLSSRTAFDGPLDPDWDQHHSLAEYEAVFEAAPAGAVIGHKGADLFYSSEAHPRLDHFVPEVRLVVLLRDPVRRAVSHYWNEVAKGRETRSFEEAVHHERSLGPDDAYARHHLGYVARGCYARSYAQLLQTFPAARVLLVTVEAIRNDPRAELGRLCDFIGVSDPRSAGITFEQRNEHNATVRRESLQGSVGQRVCAANERLAEAVVTRAFEDPDRRRIWRRRLLSPTRRSATTMPVETRVLEHLAEVYQPDAHELARLVDIDVDPWGL